MPIRRLLGRIADAILGPKCKHGNRGSCPSCWMDEVTATYIGERIDKVMAGVALVASLIVAIDATIPNVKTKNTQTYTIDIVEPYD